MTHPQDLLAEYVDGTLPEAERAAVEAHLAACEACRLEVDLARRARASLAGLPEVPVPAGTSATVLERVGALGPVTAPPTDLWTTRRARIQRLGRLAWAGGLAAAAAVAAVLVWVGVRDTGGLEEAAPPAEREAAEALPQEMAAPLPFFQAQPDVNYDEAALQALARDLADQLRAGADAALEASPVPAPTPPPGAAGEAIACIQRGTGVDPGARPIRVLDARFRGNPAYIGAFAVGPGPDQLPGRLELWVVDRATCGLLFFAQQELS